MHLKACIAEPEKLSRVPQGLKAVLWGTGLSSRREHVGRMEKGPPHERLTGKGHVYRDVKVRLLVLLGSLDAAFGQGNALHPVALVMQRREGAERCGAERSLQTQARRG